MASFIFTALQHANHDSLQKLSGSDSEVIDELIVDMVQEEPAKRPKIDEVISRFAALRESPPKKALYERLVDREGDPVAKTSRNLVHRIRTISYILRGIPPVPKS